MRRASEIQVSIPAAVPSRQPETCTLCDGSGWKIVERGGLSGAAPCECQLPARVESLTEHAAIPGNFAGASFGLFRLDHLKSDPVAFVGVANAHRAACEFVTGFSRHQDPPGLLIAGPSGTGKTHLAVAVLRGVIAMGVRGLFLDCGHLLEQVRATFGSGRLDREEVLGAAMQAELLVLDDLGAQASSDWVRDTLASVITHRYNERKATVVTTALTDDEMTKLGDRSASRLREMCRCVRIPPSTEDYRKNNSATRKRKGT